MENPKDREVSPIDLVPLVFPLFFNIFLVYGKFITLQTSMGENEFTDLIFWPAIVFVFWIVCLIFTTSNNIVIRNFWNHVKKLNIYWEKSEWISSKRVFLVVVSATAPSLGWLLLREFFRITKYGDIFFAGEYPMAIHFLLAFSHAAMALMWMWFLYDSEMNLKGK